MALVQETYKGRKGTTSQRERTYYITGVNTELEAESALLGLTVGVTGAPATLDGFVRIDSECTIEELEAGRFLGNVVWRPAGSGASPPVSSFSISFDIAGQSTRITQSKATVARYGPNGTVADDLHGVINLQDDGTVEGVEILTPALNYTVTYTFADSSITTDYVNTLALIVGTVNNGAFHGYAAGELLLCRASGQKRNDSSNAWDITFGFAVSRNCSGGLRPNGEPFTIPTPIADPAHSVLEDEGKITVTAKAGWDYLWVYYAWRKYAAGTANERSRKIPVGAYVERVYDFTDFSLLGI